MENDAPREDLGLDPKEYAAIAARFSALAPLLSGFFPGAAAKDAASTPAPDREDRGEGAKTVGDGMRKRGNREELLSALKPYLSKQRQEMADYLIRIGKLFDALQGRF